MRHPLRFSTLLTIFSLYEYKKKLYLCTGIQKIAHHLTQNINRYEKIIPLGLYGNLRKLSLC